MQQQASLPSQVLPPRSTHKQRAFGTVPHHGIVLPPTSKRFVGARPLGMAMASLLPLQLLRKAAAHAVLLHPGLTCLDTQTAMLPRSAPRNRRHASSRCPIWWIPAEAPGQVPARPPRCAKLCRAPQLQAGGSAEFSRTPLQNLELSELPVPQSSASAAPPRDPCTLRPGPEDHSTEPPGHSEAAPIHTSRPSLHAPLLGGRCMRGAIAQSARYETFLYRT
mmetsp:Transcript_99728/g.237734  ORF Transcript_99728/g.237734 Transcript_99728/m.237734 type:complete len:221 (+) Transcript_99728:975-1637(+)